MKESRETKPKDFYETPTVRDIPPVTVTVCEGLSNDPGDDYD